MTGRGIPTNHRISPRPINTLLIGNLSFENVGARLWFRIALQGSCTEGRRWAAPRAATRKANRAPEKSPKQGRRGKAITPPCAAGARGLALPPGSAVAKRGGDVTFEQP